MTLFVFFAVLAAAAMHAIWNALVKVHLDRFLSITLMTLGMGTAALVALPFVEVPKAEVWPYIIASVFFHMGYRTFLIGAYKAGDFAQTYPLARGTAPLLAAIGGMVVVKEVPSSSVVIGVPGQVISRSRPGSPDDSMMPDLVGVSLQSLLTRVTRLEAHADGSQTNHVIRPPEAGVWHGEDFSI